MPGAVQNLVVAQTGVDELTATWQPSGSEIPDTYSVTLKSSDGTLSMQTAVTRATSVTFGSLVADVTYSVAVSANNAFGAGALVETQTTGLIVTEDYASKTIGLWHETVPTGSWDVDNIQSYLSGTGATAGLGFESYAADYVSYVSNLKRLAAADGRNIDLGAVYFAIGDPGNEDWTTNNVYKYAIPSAEGIDIPLINEHVIIELAKAGVEEFGFVVGDLADGSMVMDARKLYAHSDASGGQPKHRKTVCIDFNAQYKTPGVLCSRGCSLRRRSERTLYFTLGF